MHSSRRIGTRTASIVVALASWALGAPATAQPNTTPNNVTWGELARLPDFCKDVQSILYGGPGSNQSPRAPMWLAKMGPAFWHMHHYCWGLAGVMRAEGPGVPAQERRHLYSAAINDYRYVVRNSPPDFIMLPEIHLRIGEAQLKLDRPAEAYLSFESARTLKPDYWPAYSRWIEVLVRLNRRRDALEHAQLGLKHCPDSEQLRRQFADLGGKAPPVPVPVPVPVPAASTPGT